MATQRNFEIKNGLSVAGTERIASNGDITGNHLGTFGGTTVTRSAGTNNTQLASTAYVDVAITNLIDSSPGTLNTLNELAAALGDDASFSTTVTNSIATKAPLASPSFTGTIRLDAGATTGSRTIKDDYSSGALANQGFLRSSGGNYWGYGTYQEGSGNWKSAVSIGLERSVFAIDEDQAYWSHAASQTVSIGSDLTTQPTKKIVFNLENTRVGIGTDAPGATLHVNASGGANFQVSRTGVADMFYVEADGTNAVIRNPGSNALVFQMGGASEKMRIDASGNVGIGANSVSSWAKLQVAGTAGAQTGAKQALYIQSPTATAAEGVGIRMSAASGSHEAVGIIGMVNNASGNTGSMTFHTYNLGSTIPEVMRITNTGNVGIGTDTPSATDWGSASKVLQISGTQPVLSLKDTTGEFQIANSNQNLYFYDTAGSGEKTRIFIKADGNVGIGTTSPFGITTNRTCLSVNGTSSVSLNIGVGNAQKGYLYTDGSATQLGSVGSIPLKFAPNDSPKMELAPSGELSLYGNKMVIDSDYGHWSGKYQHLTCHNTITSSNTWTDVAYVSYSPSLTIQGIAQRDNNGGLGTSCFLGTIFGGYGSTSVVAERSTNDDMNGGAFGPLEYRYLNGGASSGNYRLQVRISIGSGTMYVTTTLTGHAWQEIYED